MLEINPIARLDDIKRRTSLARQSFPDPETGEIRDSYVGSVSGLRDAALVAEADGTATTFEDSDVPAGLHDPNESGGSDLSDLKFLLQYLFVGGEEPPAPFETAGADPTDDGATCYEHPYNPRRRAEFRVATRVEPRPPPTCTRDGRTTRRSR